MNNVTTIKTWRNADNAICAIYEINGVQVEVDTWRPCFVPYLVSEAFVPGTSERLSKTYRERSHENVLKELSSTQRAQARHLR